MRFRRVRAPSLASRHRRSRMLTDPGLRRGRHRAPSRWSRHRPAHQDPRPSLVSLLVPAWKLGTTATDRSRPGGQHREDILIDDRSGPQWTVPSPEPTLNEVLVDHAPLFESEIEIVLEEVEPEDVITVEPAAQPPVAGPPTPEPEPSSPTTVVDRSDVLPPSDEEESSSLAGLFGFGERQVNFVPDWSRDFEVTGDTAWDTLPTLADVATTGETTPGTGGSIQRLWDATEDHAIVVNPIEVAEPVETSEKLTDNRRFRRSMVLAGVVAILLVAWVIREIGEQPNRAAVAREVAYAEAAQLIGDSIGPVERSVALVGEPDLSASDFSQLTGDLDALDGAARSAAALATEPLPRTPIVGSSLPIDELILPKRLLEQAAMQALTIEQRIGDAVSYRLTFSRAFDLPPLPDEAGLVDIGTIGGDLSVAIAQTEQILGQLPDDGFFAAHRQAAYDVLDQLEQSQPVYFAALRAGDTVQARSIRDAMVRSAASLHASLADPLAEAETWAGEQLAQLREVLIEIDGLVGPAAR